MARYGDRCVVTLLGLLLLAAPLHAATATDAGTILPNDNLQPKMYNLTELCPGTTAGATRARYLTADLTKCEPKARASPATPVIYTFDLDGKPDFDMLVTLRMSAGSADMLFISVKYGTEDSDQTDPVNTLLDVTSARGANDLAMLSIRRGRLAAGTYQIKVVTTSSSSSFVLKVFTPSKQVQLVDKELVVLQKLRDSCCPEGDYTTDTCAMLRVATDANRTLDQDICNVPPNMCDLNGSLFRLALRGSGASGSGLNCTGGQLPTSLVAGLPSLSFLDLGYNLLGGTTQQVAKDLSSNAKLETLRLSGNLITGGLSCDLLKNIPTLTSLFLNYNQITGAIPACYLASPTLSALQLNYNSLEGTLPPFAKGIPLTEFWALADSANGGALSGSLPPSISNAAELLVFAVSNQNFSGGLPDFPVSIEELAIDSNNLQGPFPASFSALTNLTILYADFNNFTGPFPADIFNFAYIEFISLSNNRLTGALADVSWEDVSDTLSVVDLSSNALTGPLPAFPLDIANFAVTSLLLGGNSLDGTLEAFAASLLPPAQDGTPSNRFIRLGLGGNKFTGTVPGEFQNLALFNFTDQQRARNILDLSDNSLTGPFPVWLVEALLASPINIFYGISFAISGNALTCPAVAALPPSAALATALSQFACNDATTGTQLSVAQALAGDTSGSGTPSITKGLTVVGAYGSRDGTSNDGTSSGSGKKALSTAALAGIGVGAVLLGAVLLAAVAFAVVKHRKRRRYSDFEAGPKIAMQPLPQQSSMAAENTV